MSKYGDINSINARIANLSHRRQQLDKEMKNLRKQKARLTKGTVVGEGRSGTQDNLAVPTVELREHVIEALHEYTYHQLAAQAGVSPRTIQKIKSLESGFVTLRIADMILQACGRPEALGLTVRVIPNPRYRREPPDEDCGT